DLRFLRERTREEHPLLLSPGKLSDLPSGQVGHADLLQALHRSISVAAADRQAPADEPVSPHRHDFEHGNGKLPVDAASLRNIADLPPALAQRLPEEA